MEETASAGEKGPAFYGASGGGSRSQGDRLSVPGSKNDGLRERFRRAEEKPARGVASRVSVRSRLAPPPCVRIAAPGPRAPLRCLAGSLQGRLRAGDTERPERGRNRVSRPRLA